MIPAQGEQSSSWKRSCPEFLEADPVHDANHCLFAARFLNVALAVVEAGKLWELTKTPQFQL